MGSRVFSKHLSQNGADSVRNANIDASVTAQYWELRPATAEHLEVARLLVVIQDAGLISADAYGSNITLANGIAVNVVTGTGAGAVEDYSLTDVPVLTNGEWSTYSYDTQLITFGSGNDYVVVRWTFQKAGEPLFINGSLGQALRVTLNDDFTGLVNHSFVAQGMLQTV